MNASMIAKQDLDAKQLSIVAAEMNKKQKVSHTLYGGLLVCSVVIDFMPVTLAWAWVCC